MCLRWPGAAKGAKLQKVAVCDKKCHKSRPNIPGCFFVFEIFWSWFVTKSVTNCNPFAKTVYIFLLRHPHNHNMASESQIQELLELVHTINTNYLELRAEESHHRRVKENLEQQRNILDKQLGIENHKLADTIKDRVHIEATLTIAITTLQQANRVTTDAKHKLSVIPATPEHQHCTTSPVVLHEENNDDIVEQGCLSVRQRHANSTTPEDDTLTSDSESFSGDESSDDEIRDTDIFGTNFLASTPPAKKQKTGRITLTRRRSAVNLDFLKEWRTSGKLVVGGAKSSASTQSSGSSSYETCDDSQCSDCLRLAAEEEEEQEEEPTLDDYLEELEKEHMGGEQDVVTLSPSIGNKRKR